MNRDQLEGKWLQFKGKVKQKWGELTDDDLEQIAGQREVLEGKLQERYGYTEEQSKDELDDFFRRAG